MELNFLSPPTQNDNYSPQSDAGGAEPLQDKENCCGESCGTRASELEDDEIELLTEPISLLQAESEGDNIAAIYVGSLVEVRSLNGDVKFAGEMINYDSKNGIVTVATEQGNRDASLCEAFVIG